MGDIPALSSEQTELVEQPADVKLLVTAGPGTGKTFSLVHRLEFLVREEELEPDEILVLSFSRAAVGEIRDRLRSSGSAAVHVTVRTFDSFATQLLSDVDPDGAWQQKSFDGRIEEATRLLQDNPDAEELVTEYRHLVVDEVQDLVGPRADLVKAVLQRIPEGFTLLGDPAQGIYGFQLADEQERLRGSAALYEWVRSHFASCLVELPLSVNFRVSGHAVGPSPEVSLALRSVETDFGDIAYELRTQLLGRSLGALSDAIELLVGTEVPTAILCRTNGQALVVSRELHRNGVAHRLQRSAQDASVPAWVGKLFLDHRSERQLLRHDLVLAPDPDVAVDDAWQLLRRMNRNPRAGAVNLGDVRDRLRTRNVPDEITRQSGVPIVVSTVHRAKGLEFDNVIVVDPGEPRDSVIEQAEHARNLYVAMTRPRRTLMAISAVDNYVKGRLSEAGDRWMEAGFGRYRSSRFGFEIRPDDIEKEYPAGTAPASGDPEALQNHIVKQMSQGDQVRLVSTDPGGVGEPPRYLLEHHGVTVGMTSDQFAFALRRAMPGGRRRSSWPESIEDVYVESVETVCGSEAAGANSGLGWSGVWLRPRVTGLGRLSWGSREDR